MKTTLIGLALMLTIGAGPAVCLAQWSRVFGGSGSETVVMTLDSARQVYVAGTFQGTIDLGSEVLMAGGDKAIYVAKYSSQGVYLSSFVCDWFLQRNNESRWRLFYCDKYRCLCGQIPCRWDACLVR